MSDWGSPRDELRRAAAAAKWVEVWTWPLLILGWFLVAGAIATALYAFYEVGQLCCQVDDMFGGSRAQIFVAAILASAALVLVASLILVFAYWVRMRVAQHASDYDFETHG